MKMKRAWLLAITMTFSTQAIVLAEGYEAWYEASTDAPNSTAIPSKVHTYFDGKKFYTKSTTALGNTLGYYVEIPLNPSTIDFVKSLDAKPLGKKSIGGKECEGFQFIDPFEKRGTENWFDDTGKLYYQLVNNPDGAGGKYEQTRTDFKLNPQTCTLPTDPDITPSNTPDITSTPKTVPVNDDESAFTKMGTEKTNLKQPTKPQTSDF